MAEVVVVDSGILITRALKEPLAGTAKALLHNWRQHNVQLTAPSLFRYEIVAVTRKAVAQGRLTHQEGSTALAYLMNYPVQLHLDDNLLRRGYELATIHNRPTAYDAQYLALAERFGCEFWTSDRKLFNAVEQQLTWVKWLGNFVP